MSFIPTLSVLNALKAALVALQLPSTYSAIADYPKAFTTVEFYRNENLIKAFEDMFIFDNRVAIIVPAGDTDEAKLNGRILEVRRVSEFVILIADRDYSKSRSELIGSSDTPGVITLKDLVAQQLTGATLNLHGVMLTPTGGEPLHLTESDQENAPGRDCWALTFNTSAGRMTASKAR